MSSPVLRQIAGMGATQQVYAFSTGLKPFRFDFQREKLGGRVNGLSEAGYSLSSLASDPFPEEDD